jgi:hypothetical protein
MEDVFPLIIDWCNVTTALSMLQTCKFLRYTISKEVLKRCLHRNEKMLHFNLKMLKACESGQLDIVKFLYSLGADIRFRGDHPIQIAAISGHLDLVKFLHSNGANPLSCDQDYCMIIVNKCYFSVIRYLLSVGCKFSFSTWIIRIVKSLANNLCDCTLSALAILVSIFFGIIFIFCSITYHIGYMAISFVQNIYTSFYR